MPVPPQVQQAVKRFDPLVERTRPVLAVVSKGLRVLGRTVQAISLLGVAGTFLLTLAFVNVGGWWGLLALVVGVVPWRAWLVGHHAVVGSGLLGDPGRIHEVAHAASGGGRRWLDQVAGLQAAAKGRKFGPMARAVVGTGRSVWAVLSPSIEGASSLRELAIWPKTVAGLTAAVLSPFVLVIGFVALLASFIG